MQAFTGQLSDDYEYAIVWWGQSNARPWGDRDLEGYVASPHLKLAQAGQDLTFLRIDGFPLFSGTIGGVGTKSVIIVAETMVPDHWVGGEVRFLQTETSDANLSDPVAGVAKVLSNTATQLVVEWTTAFGGGVNAIPWRYKGYVHLQDKWKGYSTVRVLTPYQPEAPGDYPTTAPTVPGYAIPSTISSYSDAGVFLPFAWDEGVEGAGFAGDGGTAKAATVATGVVSLTGSSADAFGTTNLYAGAKITLTKGGASYVATIATNGTGGTMTVGSWSPSTPADATDYAYEISLPHWKNNPYWAAPGLGFRYPNNDMLPCSDPRSALGEIYNRPRGRLTPSYKAVILEAGSIDKTWNASGISQCTSGGTAGSFIAYKVNFSPTDYRIRIARTDFSVTPSTGRIQFEFFARAGNILNLVGWQATAGSLSLNGNWRCKAMQYSNQVLYAAVANTDFASGGDTITINGHTLKDGDQIQFTGAGAPVELAVGTKYYVVSSATNTFKVEATPGGGAITLTQKPSGTASVIGYGHVDLVAYLGAAVDGSTVINSTATANAWVTRMVPTLHHRFGALVEYAWRVSNVIGKRVNVIHLGVNSSAQILRNIQNYFGFKGQIGWWDYNKYLDWTPSNTDGNAARLKKMIATMAPAALAAEGNTKPLKILGIVGFQGEGDAIVEAGRELYAKTINTFYNWLRSTIQNAGLSYYGNAKRIPVVHASLPKIPWEITSAPGYGGTINGDTQGLVNAAIADFAAKDGFAATFDTNDSPKLDDTTPFGLDPLHFNGYGEARNGELAADAWVQAANRALPHTGDAKALSICNLALSHIGEHAGITSIDPPDGSALAALCAKFYPIARDSLLEMKQWSFTSKRVTLTSVVNSWSEWDYSYAVPGDVLNVVSVLPPDAQDDYSTRFSPTDYQVSPQLVAAGQYVPQPYAIETDVNGNKVLYSDQQNAVLRYNAYVTDSNQFPPLFVIALSWHLASMLAGPVLKGEVGSAEAKRCQAMMAAYLGKAETSDGNQRNIKPEQITPWMSNR